MTVIEGTKSSIDLGYTARNLARSVNGWLRSSTLPVSMIFGLVSRFWCKSQLLSCWFPCDDSLKATHPCCTCLPRCLTQRTLPTGTTSRKEVGGAGEVHMGLSLSEGMPFFLFFGGGFKKEPKGKRKTLTCVVTRPESFLHRHLERQICASEPVKTKPTWENCFTYLQLSKMTVDKTSAWISIQKRWKELAASHVADGADTSFLQVVNVITQLVTPSVLQGQLRAAPSPYSFLAWCLGIGGCFLLESISPRVLQSGCPMTSLPFRRTSQNNMTPQSRREDRPSGAWQTQGGPLSFETQHPSAPTGVRLPFPSGWCHRMLGDLRPGACCWQATSPAFSGSRRWRIRPPLVSRSQDR